MRERGMDIWLGDFISVLNGALCVFIYLLSNVH